MSWVPPATAEPEYREWDVEQERDWRYLGMLRPAGRPVFYNQQTGRVHEGYADHEAEQMVPQDPPSWELDAEETIGQYLERVGEETGWDGLSEFAREHLEDDENET